jgi:hypothetical protein
MVTVGGLVMVGALLVLPSPEHRIGRGGTHLDEIAPVWQFGEYHARGVDAPPAAVFDAIKRVRPDEIFLFRTLIGIRTAGQARPESVRDAITRYESLIDIATHSTFVYLADDPPRELVIGTVVGWPSGQRRAITPTMFQEPLPPGFVLGAMNYIVTPGASGGSLVSTETRVFANSPSARRRFGAYWRVIYPGSALIRRMWLRAIGKRATGRKHP